MKYEVFKQKIMAIIRRTGAGITARFSNEDGKYTAVCSDGTTIIGNSISLKMTVLWGSGHQAIV